MNDTELKQRTKLFALRVIRLVDSLPRKLSAEVVGPQLLRSGTSVAANYRSACRARSHADFIAKMGIVEEEADESVLWLERLAEAGIVPQSKLGGLAEEASSLTAIAVASIRTAKQRAQQIRSPKFAARNRP